MGVSISQQSYGKSSVRLTHVNRRNEEHDLIQLVADVVLTGDFDSAYTEGDNSKVIPTDTMKNTVYAIAKTHGVENIESYGRHLANRFVQKFDQVQQASVNIRQKLWQRIDLDGEHHGHAFTSGGNEEKTCRIVAGKDEVALFSGIAGLQVLKTTESGFSGFQEDEFTSLEATDDRIFATTITANWLCPDIDHDWTATRSTVRDLLLDVFAHNFSPSVQKTLYEMAESVLAACPEIDEISINMPNQHHLLVDLSELNIENHNEIFVPTAEPFGVITATVVRDAQD